MGHYEYPTPSLHYPNRKTIGYLGFVQDFGVQLKFNNLSTISLQVPYQVYQDGKLEKTPYYEEFRMMNKIHLPTIGWFTIGDVQEKGDGIKKYKIVPAQAEECFLAKKYISEVNGTFKFWDMANPDKTMMKMIMGYLPGWNIGTIDASLLTKYRTFDINSKMTVYTFIMNKVAKAYECFFLFDTETKT